MLGCEDGDVRLTRDNFPQIYWNYEWWNICQFQFADNTYGIDQFCKKVGLYEGGTTKNASKEDEKLYKPMKHYESFLVGSCKDTDTWPDCEVDCNVEGPGGGCSYREYHSGNETKEYYVCRKEQSWLYFLYCNGPHDLPLSSCYGKYIIIR